MRVIRTLVLVALVMAASTAGAAPISYATSGSSYTQNFNTLPNQVSGGGDGTVTGLTSSTVYAAPGQSTAPTSAEFGSGSYTALTGWFFAGGTVFAVNNGANVGTAATSFGSTGASDRAMGGQPNASNGPQFGAQILNSTGNTMTQFTLSFTAEQWRRAANAGVMVFEYAITGDSSTDVLRTGTFTAVSALEFTPPQTGSGAVLDGNLSANRQALGGTVTAITWGANQYLWLRWSQASGSSLAGSGIDDLTFSAVPEPATIGVLVLGAAGLVLRRRRRA